MPLAPDQVLLNPPKKFDCDTCGGHFELQTVHRSIADDPFEIEVEFQAMMCIHMRSCKEETRGNKA